MKRGALEKGFSGRKKKKTKGSLDLKGAFKAELERCFWKKREEELEEG